MVVLKYSANTLGNTKVIDFEYVNEANIIIFFSYTIFLIFIKNKCNKRFANYSNSIEKFKKIISN